MFVLLQCLYRGGKYLLPEKAIERVNNVTAKEVKAVSGFSRKTLYPNDAQCYVTCTVMADEIGKNPFGPCL